MAPNRLTINWTDFSGPLFIVGMPRSGTKLLRDLLNQHPKIGIPTVESQFIPYMIKRFGNPPDFGNDDEFHRFYEEFGQTTFFRNMQKNGYVLDQDHLGKEANRTSWASIIQVILRFYAPQGKGKDFVWGDKTPGYVNHMQLLKALFPEARFLHIIRDPRDYCLSVKKTWGKSLFRAANAWCDTLETAQTNAHQLGKDYMEVLYESLLDDPKNVLSDICHFLSCEFTPAMTRLDRPSENLGEARGQTRIVQSNKKKYLTRLSSSQIRRIEEIVYPVAHSIGYEFEYDVGYRPLNSLSLKMYRLYDGWASVKFHIKEKGLRQGLWYFYSLHQQSSWR